MALFWLCTGGAVAGQLARLASEVMEHVDPKEDGEDEDEEADDGEQAADEWEDVDDDDRAPAEASKRKLQQAGTPPPPASFTATPNGPNPFTGIANAFRFIFSNTFDWFRARGLYGLVPVIADIRGFLARYNWIGDLLLLIATPVENLVNANFFPLPQTNDDFTALVRRFFSDYCTYEEVASSAQVLGGFVGPTFRIELKPVSCPIYADPVLGRSYVSFTDCDPAQLIIRTTPLQVTEAYLSAAEYKGAECKYTEVYGNKMTLKPPAAVMPPACLLFFCSPVQVTEAYLSAAEYKGAECKYTEGIDIVPTLIQINPDLRSFPYRGPEGVPDSGAGIQLTAANNVARNATGTFTDPLIRLEAQNAAEDGN
ncbi:hypothetical protein OEZ85_004583 [Tetradesmus obliquus]|uniref:Uncharacterized protein n=1 Tax=Tetradesmus obliquus TaxID=3088 RepID=A0ABY8UPQ9_TETOB|nr:hypothetical protein OEZ85_004583 [Tetradesmus obliquus]